MINYSSMWKQFQVFSIEIVRRPNFSKRTLGIIIIIIKETNDLWELKSLVQNKFLVHDQML